MCLKEVTTVKVKCAKSSIPGHVMAHASGLFWIQCTPTPYSAQLKQETAQHENCAGEVQ